MILITGSAGYIGSELCKKFSILKIDYIGIDNFSNTHKINIFDKKKSLCFVFTKLSYSEINFSKL